MARKIEVEILASAAEFSRELKKASHETHSFGSGIKAGALVAAAGVGIAAGAVTEFVKSAIDEQKVDAKMDAQLKALGVNYEAHAKHISKVIDAQEKLSGFTKEDLITSFTAFSRVTKGDVGKALADNALAMNIARGKGIDLSTAQGIVTKASMGMVGALRRQGIDVQAVTTATDALKESHHKVTAAMKEAAKAADLAATKHELLATLQQKFAGQAEAYGQTAAGAMDRFHNATHDLEVSLGTALLPTVTKVAGGLADLTTKLQNSATVHRIAKQAGEDLGRAWRALVPVFDLVGQATMRIVAAVREHWPEISRTINQVMTSVRQIITGVVAIAQAIWARFGSDIEAIAGRSFRAAIAIVKDAVQVILATFKFFADVLHGRWGKAWDDLKTIASRSLDAVVIAIRTMVENAFTEAKAIGAALVDGIIAGLGSLKDRVVSAMSGALHSALSSVKGAFGIHSPSTVTKEELGQPLGEGVIEGWIVGTAQLPSKMSQKLRDAIDQARQAIDAKRSEFTSAFSDLSSMALSAFDSNMAAWKSPAQKLLDKIASQQDVADFKARMADAQQAHKHALNNLQQFFNTNPAGPANADQQDQLNQLKQAVTDSEKQIGDLRLEQRKKHLEAIAAEEQKQHDAQAAVERINFDKALTALSDHLVKQGATAASATESVLTLLRGYGVNFATVGRSMGIAWIQALKDAIQEAAGKSGKLAGSIGSIADGITVPKLASGGIVTRPTLALIGEAGPEAVVPLGRGGTAISGMTVVVNAPNYVGSKTELMDAVVEGLARYQRRGGTIPGLA